MARRKQSRGKCTFCGREMTRGGLVRHLKACPQREEATVLPIKSLAKSKSSIICKCRMLGGVISGYTWR
jgi:hypothetical protein